MILVRTVSGWLLAIDPQHVSAIMDISLGKDGEANATSIKIDGSSRPVEVQCSVIDIVKAIDQHNSTGKSVSLVEEVKL